MAFEVIDIIDGGTFKVKPKWKWNEKEGDSVKAKGYNSPIQGEAANIFATNKLKSLILNQLVELKTPAIIDDEGKVYCDVFLNGVNIAKYFPEYHPSIDNK